MRECGKDRGRRKGPRERISAEPGVIVDRGDDPARAIDGLPVGSLLALEALEEAVEDGADFGHVPLEHARGRLLPEALLEHEPEVVWYGE